MQIMHQPSIQIFGCYISSSSLYSTASESEKIEAEQEGKYFRSFIWNAGGFDEQVKRLVNLDYGNDLVLILFQFYVNPLTEVHAYLKDIERYRPKEKSIGVCIIVTDENFFSKSRSEQIDFISQAALDRISQLKNVVKRNKLVTNMEKLEQDLREVLLSFH